MLYVDPLQPCERRPDWWWPYSCHLYADGLEELHAFATRLQLRQEWFQDRPYLPHYDLTPSMRRLAIHYGAHPTSRRHVSQMIRQNRQRAEVGPY